MSKNKECWINIYPRIAPATHAKYKAFIEELSGGGGGDENTSGALFLWPLLPASLREMAIRAAQGLGEIGDDYWADVREAFVRAFGDVTARRIVDAAGRDARAPQPVPQPRPST